MMLASAEKQPRPATIGSNDELVLSFPTVRGGLACDNESNDAYDPNFLAFHPQGP